MLNLLSQIKTWLRGGKLIRKTPQEHILGWDEADIPRYPPFMKGLPAVPVDKILHTQIELIQRIRQSVTVNASVFDRHYQPVIQRFCDYVHLLPASQSHHHRGAGGLFRHSLEVGLYALQVSERVLVDDLGKTPAERREMEPRWQLAIFLAALCHDAGKPVTDLTITSSDRTVVWKPIVENLHAWADRCGVDAYFLDWREGRGRQHTSMANLIAERIIGTESFVWLEEGGLELVLWLMESLNSNPSPVNPIHKIVVQADQASVERDLKTIGATMAGYDIGVPVERLLIDVMHRLVKEGIWQINEPGARVWKIAGATYLVWPAGGEDMARIIRDEKIPGLARTADGILDMLVERNLIHVSTELDTYYWDISPEVLKEKIPNIRLQAIRLNDDSQVSSLPLSEVEGVVYGENDHCVHEAEDTQDGDVTHNETSQHVNSEVAKETIAPGSIHDLEPVAASESTLKPAEKAQAEDVIELEGEAGRILQFLLHSLQSGECHWGCDIFLNESGYLLVKWPDTLRKFDLPAKTILDELSVKQWLWVDPVTPWKKVTEYRVHGDTIKVIRFEKAISHTFNQLCKTDNKCVNPTQIPAEQIQPDTPEIIVSEEKTEDKPKKSGRPKSDMEFPTDDDLLVVLRSIEKDNLDEDGWSSIDRKLLSKKIRKEGYRCTIVFLKEIAKNDSEHFSMDGMMFRWRL